MDLAGDLLDQARHLARQDTGKPKQASLRRAVSTAYYALFHLLIADFVHTMLPGHKKALMDRVSRVFNHADMLKSCRQWSQTAPPLIIYELTGGPIHARLNSVAKTFIEMQEARHEADYDVSARLSRSTVLQRIEATELAFKDWSAMSKTDQGIAFLASLAFATRWSR